MYKIIAKSPEGWVTLTRSLMYPAYAPREQCFGQGQLNRRKKIAFWVQGFDVWFQQIKYICSTHSTIWELC